MFVSTEHSTDFLFEGGRYTQALCTISEVKITYHNTTFLSFLSVIINERKHNLTFNVERLRKTTPFLRCHRSFTNDVIVQTLSHLAVGADGRADPGGDGVRHLGGDCLDAILTDGADVGQICPTASGHLEIEAMI